MGEGDDGLRLSLSLDVPRDELNLMPFGQSSHRQNRTHLHNGQIAWNQLFQVSGKFSNAESLIRGIDVNRTPSVADAEDEAGVSSPNSTVSSISGKVIEKGAILGDDNETERAYSSRGISDEEDGENGDGSRKKLRLSKEQSLVLEETFKEHCTLNPKQKLALAKHLNLRPRQVEVWFQNRRARTKLKQTEVDCEYLKKCCENLTAENRRLQKEVVELRALKLSPHLYTHMKPPTTLTMCPSCERVAVSSSSAAGNPSRHPAMASSSPQRKGLNPWAAIALQHGSAPASG